MLGVWVRLMFDGCRRISDVPCGGTLAADTRRVVKRVISKAAEMLWMNMFREVNE